MLSVSELRQLEHLTLGAGTAAVGSGSRVAGARGAGLEFKDYRPYLPGDDPRSIDWTVDARLRQLVVRVFQAEGQTRLHLLVDASGSMAVGVPTKLACAQRLAAALAHVAVQRREPVGVTVFGEDIRTSLRPASGRRQLFRALERLRMATASGPSDLDRALMAYGAATRGPGLAVVLSDWLVPRLPVEGLSFLLHRRLTPVVVQILADADLEPAIAEATELVDSEDPTASPVVVDGAAVSAYLAQLASSRTALETFCRTRAISLVQLRSSTNLDAALGALRDAGVIAVHT